MALADGTAQPSGGMQNGANQAGTEFYFSFPPCYEEESAGGDNSIRVFIASDAEQDVRVSIPGKGFDTVRHILANNAIEIRIPTQIAQPFLKGGRNLAPPERVYPGAAVHVVSESPVICYGMTRYQYTSDGFLALPVARLGSEYIVGAWPQYTAVGASYHLTSITTISAAYDSTTVSFEMGGNNLSKTTGGLKPGQTSTFFMNAGDVLCVASSGDLQDVSGSYVSADKPIAVVSGNQCANVPAGVPWCDYVDEMELPIYAWGTEYHVTPITKRLQGPIMRIFAKEKNTTIYKDGVSWRTINRNTRLQNSGYLEMRAPVGTDGKPTVSVISSDSGKPISVILYNTGQADDNVPSDPFELGLIPLQQYSTEIVWTTPGAVGASMPFTEHYVNLVYPLDGGGAIPDDLEFAKVENNQFTWQRVSQVWGTSIGKRFTVPINGRDYACKLLSLPGDGVYRLRCSQLIGAYSYGFSAYDSYGYPCGGMYNDLAIPDSTVPVITVVPIPAPLDAKAIGIHGKVTDMPADPNTRSNLALIYLDKKTSKNCKLTYGSNSKFIAGTSSETDWKLTVIDSTLPAKGIVHFGDRNGNDTSIVYVYQPSNQPSAKLVQLSGIIIDEDAKPVANAKVTIDSAGREYATMTTDANGQYSVLVPPGNYHVVPYLKNFSFDPKVRFQSVKDQAISSAGFTATLAKYPVSGTVTWKGAKPVGVILSISGVDLRGKLREYSINTAGDGSYIFAGVQLGSYTVTPSKAGWKFTPEKQYLTVEAKQTLGVDFEAEEVSSVEEETPAMTMQTEVIPNPVAKTAQVTITSTIAAIATVTVSSSSGERVILLENVALALGNTTLTLPTEELPSGAYRVVISSGSHTSSTSFMIVR